MSQPRQTNVRAGKPSACKFLTEYTKGTTRVVCRTHDWQTTWMNNLDAIAARVEHERIIEGGK